MTSSIKVLTTSTLDSSPSILLISPNGLRTLINCGEGCQRSFLESASDRVRSINQICLTHIGYDATGGLPGLILTSADAAEASSSSQTSSSSSTLLSSDPSSISNDSSELPTKNHKNNDKHGTANNNSSHSSDKKSSSVVGSLHVIGPTGTQKYISSLRHFMKRDNFQLRISEGSFQSKSKSGDGVNTNGKKRGKKRKHNSNVENNSSNNNHHDDDDDTVSGLFGVTSIPMKRKIKSSNCDGDTDVIEINVSSFIFTTSSIPGKFQIQKAKELGIPPGPLYAQLKAGKTIKFKRKKVSDSIDEKEEEEMTVEPSQVLEGGSDGVAVSLIYCPDENVLDQFSNEDCGIKEENKGLAKLNRFKKTFCNTDGVVLEVMIHYTPKSIFQSNKYQSWIRSFDENIQHITMHPMEDHMLCSGNEEADGSPFRSAVLGAMTRSLIHKDLYAAPFPVLTHNDEVKEDNTSQLEDGVLNICRARAQMVYNLIPLAKKGLCKDTIPQSNNPFGLSSKDYASVQSSAHDSGAIVAAKSILETSSVYELNTSTDTTKSSIESNKGELIFTGTGSAIPCKHRNVTGIYMQVSNGNGILLDVGEGTIGQLIRSWMSICPTHENQTDYIRKRLIGIKAIWISHPHADHHLGIIRFLSERNAIIQRSSDIVKDRVVLMASTSLLQFLDEYSAVDPTIAGGYLSVDCRDTLPERDHPLGRKLYDTLGIQWCASVPVSHCYHSYALVLDGTSFGRLVYSGDCRPSDRLIFHGQGADLLIHEATFEDGMEEEAVLKRHSTVGEALSVGKKMNAKAIILTHFSQRYPRIPPLQKESDTLPFPIAFAFDFMTVKPSEITIAAKLTPALRLLYPDTTEETKIDCEGAVGPSAKEILSVPGVFATSTFCDR